MANNSYKSRDITHFTHNAYFQRGMRQKRLGLRVSAKDTLMADIHDQLCYEYGRQFAAMFPEIQVREVSRKKSEIEDRVIVAWNTFAREQPSTAAQRAARVSAGAL